MIDRGAGLPTVHDRLSTLDHVYRLTGKLRKLRSYLSFDTVNLLGVEYLIVFAERIASLVLWLVPIGEPPKRDRRIGYRLSILAGLDRPA